MYIAKTSEFACSVTSEIHNLRHLGDISEDKVETAVG